MFKLRSYQKDFLTKVHELLSNNSNSKNWHLFHSPTGTGKSLMELKLLQQGNNALITPRLEIIRQMLDKCGEYVHNLDVSQLIDLSWNKYHITTPIRFRRMLAGGQITFCPDILIIDEAHHSIAETYKDIEMYLNGVPVIGLTATPFRGTPKGTLELRQQYDTVNEILSLKQAVDQGYFVIPKPQIWPLIDDDLIDVQNGEFKTISVNAHILNHIHALANNCRKFWCSKSNLWDRVTLFAVPSKEVATKLKYEFDNLSISTDIITQDTPYKKRQNIFNDVISQCSALIQIDIISEGVDLPFRRIIDIRPTMSPVRWLQQVGRTRIVDDADIPPDYICCNRNLERHGYLMEGLLPNSDIARAQNAFPHDEKNGPQLFNSSKRSGIRVTGLEGLGKFVTTPVKLLNGLTVFTYHLVHMDKFKRREYYAVLHPNSPDILKAVKTSSINPDTNEITWGRWSYIKNLPDLVGCTSATVGPLTPKMEERWKKSAESYGLNSLVPLTNRAFQLLPVLMNLGCRFNHI